MLIQFIPLRLLNHPKIQVLSPEQKGYYLTVLLIMADDPFKNMTKSQLTALWPNGWDILVAIDDLFLNDENSLYCKSLEEIAMKKQNEFENRSNSAQKRWEKQKSEKVAPKKNGGRRKKIYNNPGK